MKSLYFTRPNLFFILFAICVLCSCSTQKSAIPPELIGEWKSDMTNITVRTELKWMKFEFTSDITSVDLTIDSNKTAHGFIGSAEFNNGKIRKNGGNPDRTGVAYIVQCGQVGKIFSNDPLGKKEVEIWLGPIKGEMHAELRYTEGMAQFPMADIIFRKVRTK